MPVVQVHLIEGYTDQEKSRLGRAITDAVRFVVPTSSEAVTIMINEHESGNYMNGGVRRRAASALPDPKQVVTTYLDALQQYDFVKAESFLSVGFTLELPGPTLLTHPRQLEGWIAPRFKELRKSYTGIEAFQSEAASVVYVRGTISGIYADGLSFSGVRYVDRFEIHNGFIIRQEVWTDLREEKVLV